MDIIPQIPGFNIKKKIGQGGMATVFLGIQENLKREVAIKVLDTEHFQDHNFAQRFLKEAETAANLHHQGIITIFDVGQAGNLYYISMEYLHESLKVRLKNNTGSKLPPKEVIRILKDIALALDYAQSQGVIHRDIKPDNILFRTDGTAVVADFGIAKAMATETRLTTTGISIGTPHYMSPEQMAGKQIDGRADIYSLGIVLFEMLTGDVPFKATDPIAIGIKHIQDPIPILPKPLAFFQPLLNGLLEKDPQKRFQNGQEVIEKADTLFAGTELNYVFPEDEKTELLMGIAQEKAKRWRHGLFAAIGFGMVIAGFLGLYFGGYLDPTGKQKEDIPPAKTLAVENKKNLSGEGDKTSPAENIKKEVSNDKAPLTITSHKESLKKQQPDKIVSKKEVPAQVAKTKEKSQPLQKKKPEKADLKSVDIKGQLTELLKSGNLLVATNIWKEELIKRGIKFSIQLRQNLSKQQVIEMFQRFKRNGQKFSFFVLNRSGREDDYTAFKGTFYHKHQAQGALNRMQRRSGQRARRFPKPVVVDLQKYLRK